MRGVRTQRADQLAYCLLFALVLTLQSVLAARAARQRQWEPEDDVEKEWRPTAHAFEQYDDNDGADDIPQPDVLQPPDAEWPDFSEHRCVGTALKNMTCQFTNLFYDKQVGKFVYYASNTSSPDLNALREMRFANNYTSFRIASGERPERKETCDEVEPAYLYNMMVAGSFGHIIRDNFLVFHANREDLGVLDRSYRIVVLGALFYGGLRHFNALGLRILQKYAPLVADGASTLSEYELSCTKRYMLWRDFIIGSQVLAADPLFHPGWPSIDNWGGCGSPYMQHHRDDAYARVGVLNPPPAHTHDPIRVLFHEKLVDDIRRIVNIPEVIARLRRRFPTLVFDSKIVSLLTPREQLLEMSRTSIFVSPHGSTSIRMQYLPDGAHVIVVNADESQGETYADYELLTCWDKLPYVTIHRYRCLEPEETVLRNLTVPKGQDPVWYLWWRSDKRVKAKKLGDMIEEAVRLIELERDSART